MRAAGPSLEQFGVAGALVDPVLTVFAGQASLAQNDDWDPALAAEFVRVGAAAWTPGSRDAAVSLTLNPGSYTAQVAGKGGSGGVALIEVFEADGGTPPAKLSNISTRSLVGTGGEIQIGGFVIESGPRKVVVRASGPALAPLARSCELACALAGKRRDVEPERDRTRAAAAVVAPARGAACRAARHLATSKSPACLAKGASST